MKKVVYSIRKVRNSNEKLSGFGFINDEGTLFCKCISKTVNVTPALSMTLISIVSLYSEKKKNTRVT